MFFKEYCANVDGLEKRVGFLGEVHLYTAKESLFAKDALDHYDFIASEHDGMVFPKGVLKIWPFLGIPKLCGVLIANKDRYGNPDLQQLAKRAEKEIHFLEDAKEDLFTSSEKAAMIASGLLGIPSGLYDLFRYKIGDKKALDEYLIDPSKPLDFDEMRSKGIYHKLSAYFMESSTKRRDAKMAEKSIEYLKGSEESFLFNFGYHHFNDIISNLENRIDLKPLDPPAWASGHWVVDHIEQNGLVIFK